VAGSSAIEWTEATWNPVTGCSKVSPGCAHCYAETFAERWRGVPGNAYEQGFDLKLWPSRLEYPLKWKKPKVIFVNSMSDIFHEDIPDEYIAEIFDVMVRADHHIYQVLTKRHERMVELAPRLPWPRHIWMGVTIENRRFINRANYLRQVPAATRFISAEPLLGYLEGLDLADIHWLIAGGESGHKHRPVKPEWIRHVRDLALESGTAFFFKQWGGLRSKSGGRMLDGQEWSEMPDHDLRPVPAPTGPKMPRKRQRDVPDDADEKWVYTEHTRAKHEILHRYLGAWLAILGRGQRGSAFRHKRLMLLDGFAGRGRYIGGEDGSPRIMFDRAVETVDAGFANAVWIGCAEPNASNFKDHLEPVCEALKHPGVDIHPTQETFEQAGTKLAEWAEKQNPKVPIFVMVDPYGVRGVPMALLQRLLQIDRVEVLLTLMVRDSGRFIDEENYEKPLTDLFGGDAWRQCAGAERRDECLLLKFQEVVRPEVACWATPFRVFEDERRTVLYYLVHLTNNARGMREMKKSMVKKAGDMTFWPVTVRPPDQLELEVAEAKPYPSLQQRLAQNYAGRSMTFVELLNEDYPDGVWLEPDYRWALDGMEKEEPQRVTIVRNRLTNSGKPATRGVQEPDVLTFPAR
jgi:three-Cys-motif partner protein